MELASRRFPSPGTTVLRRRSRALNAAATTCPEVIRRPIEALSEAVSKNAVSVAPGHRAVTRTPVPRVSAHNASVNESLHARHC